ncbi:bifunctional 2-polyprenyl-6-hydroxyphenol methylase/3-demethylubiquinol 3-O-methyltransferase UbiG [Sandaracinobacteroides hominis]|uniref:bifunctional 2-polyprenyl-6-hydroxyphenol methylase/3-demethylubiquinol 3-O-methyltransferase UbiG n=1 Tax=Sandaracinobacteroides hominis TaxID=2780086 RepID=UPI0018F45083|nr:bifunctional 2-polyprenyl-6-hydroxyphenol methylase/3-demethylubiquinol 3-O-methyltransferase UbiG [Sandaracinobacteroides hominis]
MTADAANIALFGTLAADWWDPEGSSRLLHRINPIRLAYIRDAAVAHFDRDPKSRRALTGLRALDIGCGAGLVAEPLARMGADVTGLDAGPEVIAAARAHAAAQGLPIRYECAQISDFEPQETARFDFISCLEVMEHVTDIPAFLSSISRLLAADGLLVFSTPNRTPISWAVLIAGAEKITRLIPEHGHDWKQFVTPDELTQKLAAAGLRTETLSGLSWSPTRGFHISNDLRINYIGTAVHA